MPQQKSIDYKETVVNYYLVKDKTQEKFNALDSKISK